jgi:hypothetical protein
MTDKDIWLIIIAVGLLYTFSTSRKEWHADLKRKKMKNRS